MTWNIAHRGADSLAPENTLAAARKAFECGADMWELDVAVSADGALVLLHDDTLLRTTNVRAVFPDRDMCTSSTFTLAELQALDCGSWFAEADPFGTIARGEVSAGDCVAYRGERIPTLREALEFTRSHDRAVNVEIKSLPAPMEDFPVATAVGELVQSLAMQDRVIVSSFIRARLDEVRAVAAEVRIHALVGYAEDEFVRMPTGGALDGIHPRYNRVSDEQVRAAMTAGHKVIPWVVNEIAAMEHFLALGVDGIITDYPQRLHAVLQDRS